MLPLIAVLALTAVDETAPPHEKVEEVVVTAPLQTKAEAAIQGVSVISESELITLPPTTLGDTLEKLPGVSASAFGAGASRPIIRGLGEDRIRILSNGIGVIDASAASPDHAVSAESSEANRIEVLRGAQALAYGSNAIGGVVNVIDGLLKEARPEKAVSGGALFNYSSVDNGVQGAAHVDLAYGPIAIRAQGAKRETDDYSIPGAAESAVLRAITGTPATAFRRLPDSDVRNSNYAIGISAIGEGRSIGATFRRLTGNYGIPGDGPDGSRIDLKQDRVEARGESEIGVLGIENVKISAAYGDYQHVELEGGVTPSTMVFNEGFEIRSEFRHQPIFGVKGVFGVQYLRSDNGAIGVESFINPNIQRDVGGFWLERWEKGRFSLEGGLRIETRRIEPDNQAGRRFTPVSFSVGGTAHASEDLLFGLTFSRAERAPNPAELFADGPHLATRNFELGNTANRIETGNAIEFATHYSHSRLSLDFHAFTTRFNGYIALSPDGRTAQDLIDSGIFAPTTDPAITSLPVFVFNQRDARFSGGEVETHYELYHSDNLHITADGSVEYVRAVFLNSPDLNSRNVPRIPPLNAVFGVESAWKHLSLRLEGVKAVAQNNIADFELPTRGYRLFNAQFVWRLGGVKGPFAFVLDAKNLTNADERLATSFLKDVAPLPGRNFRLTLKARF